MAVTWLYATLLISVCSFCRGQHADVTFGQFWFSALIAILKTPGASLLILGYDATASSNNTNIYHTVLIHKHFHHQINNQKLKQQS